MGPECHVMTVGPAMFSIGYAQTINDDHVFLFYDDYFDFVIILCAKVPSLMTNDELVLFRHGMLSSCDENIIVTREASLMNTFLLVIKCICTEKLSKNYMQTHQVVDLEL